MKSFPPIPVEYRHIPTWPSYVIKVTALPGCSGLYDTKVEVSCILLSPDRDLATLVRESFMFDSSSDSGHIESISRAVNMFGTVMADMRYKFVWPVGWMPEFENYPNPPLYFTPYFKLSNA